MLAKWPCILHIVGSRRAETLADSCSAGALAAALSEEDVAAIGKDKVGA